jgi:hypothetical protein
MDKAEIDTNFFIDAFSGRDVVIQVDVTTGKAMDITLTFDGVQNTFSSADEVYELRTNLSSGQHTLALSAGSAMEAASLRVESKAPEGSAPLTVDTWTR